MLLRENEQYKRIFIRYRLRIILNENQKNLDNIYFEIIGIRQREKQNDYHRKYNKQGNEGG